MFKFQGRSRKTRKSPESPSRNVTVTEEIRTSHVPRDVTVTEEVTSFTAPGQSSGGHLVSEDGRSSQGPTSSGSETVTKEVTTRTSKGPHQGGFVTTVTQESRATADGRSPVYATEVPLTTYIVPALPGLYIDPRWLQIPTLLLTKIRKFFCRVLLRSHRKPG